MGSRFGIGKDNKKENFTKRKEHEIRKSHDHQRLEVERQIEKDANKYLISF